MEPSQDQLVAPRAVLALSVLVTREEYCAATADTKRCQRRRLAVWLTVLGFVFAALGFAGLFFGRSISLSPSAALCLVVLGVFFVLFDGLIAPLTDKAAAARDYDIKDDLHYATKLVFDEEAVSVENSRMQGRIPLSRLSRWSETAAVFTLSVGREVHFAIPKRLLNAQQTEELRQLLASQAPAARCS